MLRSFGRFSPVVRLRLGVSKQLKSVAISELFC